MLQDVRRRIYTGENSIFYEHSPLRKIKVAELLVRNLTVYCENLKAFFWYDTFTLKRLTMIVVWKHVNDQI